MKKELKIACTNKRINMVSKIVSLLFFSAFVLLVFTTYKNITQTKYIAFLLLSGPFLIYYIFEKGSLALEGGVNLNINRRKALPYIFLGAYVFFNLLAGIFSPYNNYANGNGQSIIVFGHGRYDGLLVLLLCCLLFLCFSIEQTFSLCHINTILVTTFLAVVLGFVQMFGVNLFGFFPYGNFYSFKKDFISTLGNIDIMSTYLVIAIAVIMFSYIAFTVNRLLKAVWLFVGGISTVLLIEISVESGRVALFILLLIALPVLALSKPHFLRFLDVLAVVLLSLSLAFDINFSKSGVSFKIGGISVALTIAAVLVLALRLLIYNFLKQTATKYLFAAVLFIELLAVVFSLCYLKLAGVKGGTLGQISNMLNGKVRDNYGNNRIGLWKYTFMLASKRLFIGFGTGSFRMAFSDFTQQLAPSYSNNTYDFAHNEYLQILYNCGIFGLISYIGLVVSPIIMGIKKLYTTPQILILSFAILGYLIQAFFTFSIVLVSPLFWVLLGMLCCEVQSATN